MKYTLRKETAKDRYERIAIAYKFHYKRTSGKEAIVSYNKGYVSINGNKYRVNDFEKAMIELKNRPDYSLSLK